MPTQKERIDRALRTLRGRRITTTLVHDTRGVDPEAYRAVCAQAAHRAGTRHRWLAIPVPGSRWGDDGCLVTAAGEPVDRLLVYYPPKCPTDVTHAAVQAFFHQGFRVRWYDDGRQPIHVFLT
ncbi:hypothetical protein KBX50_05050 [Micromonospora sp. C51]|uniref:hypothetical protein n=1 Tax=Micromonospora sp. C51 TaxID=2824879 RepID=UPI001B3754F2|nr:hypothetical protein [Micromonospora sp. C51]MBQ1047825.1 hypothetical protein [Micromonospora sp. C51]